MNKAEEEHATSTKPQPGVPGVLSLILPILGFGIVYLLVTHGRHSWEGLRDVIYGFALWCLLSLAGAISAFLSFRRHGASVTAVLGFMLCAAPFLYFLYVLIINSH